MVRESVAHTLHYRICSPPTALTANPPPFLEGFTSASPFQTELATAHGVISQRILHSRVFRAAGARDIVGGPLSTAENRESGAGERT